MYQLIIGQNVIEYELIKSNRKSIGICITENGAVVVRSPKRISLKEVEEILYKKSNWIETKLSNMQQRIQSRAVKNYNANSVLYYCGNPYILELIPVTIKRQQSIQIIQQPGQDYDEAVDILRVYSIDNSEEYVKNQLILWYKEHAKKLLTQRTLLYSQEIGVTYQAVKITSPKRRWGSCTSEGNINYNWRIIMAPLPIIDYLVVHELAHRKEMNHSKNFYRIVASVLPDYKTRQEWLKTNSMMLEL